MAASSRLPKQDNVSMKSGLGDRNNRPSLVAVAPLDRVSMKSGLGDRNNSVGCSTSESR